MCILSINQKNVIFCLMLTSFLSACSSFDFLSNEEKEDTNKIINYLAPTEDERSLQVKEQLTYLESVKPALDRLIVLESDLNYLIENLKGIESTPNFVQNDGVNGGGEPSYVGNASEPLNTENNFRSGADKLPQHFSEDAFFNERTTDVKVQSVNPIQDKFKNSQIEKTSLAQADNIDAKFSGNNQVSNVLKPNVVVAENCKADNITVGKGFALHIASFKNKAIARNTALAFADAHEDIMCGKTLVLTEVMVNAARFYSIRIGSYPSRTIATKACDLVTQHQPYCAVTNFEGKLL